MYFDVDYAVLISVLVLAAGYVSTTDLSRPELHNSPLIIAQRAGDGQWSQNSRTAVMNRIVMTRGNDPAKPHHGIEIDIVLTRDGHPILSHDPWVHTTLCTNAHFRYSSQKAWQNHEFRENPRGEWVAFHGKQHLEWGAFELARKLSEPAVMRSTSMGGPQIMGFKHSRIGYDSALISSKGRARRRP